MSSHFGQGTGSYGDNDDDGDDGDGDDNDSNDDGNNDDEARPHCSKRGQGTGSDRCSRCLWSEAPPSLSPET